MSQGHAHDQAASVAERSSPRPEARDGRSHRTASPASRLASRPTSRPASRPSSVHLGPTQKSDTEHLENLSDDASIQIEIDSASPPPSLHDMNATIDEASIRCACPHPWNYLRNAKPEEYDATEAGWLNCDKQLREHDRDLAQAWKEEIDTLLVFAGLFSAILTAFNVELYTSLAPDPGVDLTNRILLQISSQLTALAAHDPSVVSAQPTSLLPAHDTKALASSVWINALWFSSLVLSLSSAAIGIIVRQWLSHFISPTSSNTQRSAQIHCLRYDRGLIAWRVPEILSLLPILLLASLVLFLIGLVLLLWTLDGIVAGITTGLVAVLFLFLVSSTILPTLRLDCPYKSPQALLFYWCSQRLRSTFPARVIRTLYGRPRAVPRNLPYLPDMSTLAEVGPSLYQRFQYALGITSDGRVRIWLQSFTTAIRSIASYLSSMMRCYLPDVSDESQTVYRNWRAQEQALLSNDAGANWMPSQDPLKIWVEENVLSCADTVLMDDSFLDTVVRPCILDPQIGQDTSYSLWRARLGELSLKRLHRIIQKKLLMNHKAGRTLCGIALDALFLTTGVFRGPNIIQRFPQYFAHHILRRFDAEYLAVAVAGCVKAMSAMEEDDLARYDMATFLSAILGQCAPSIMKQKTSASGAVHWSSACSWPQALGMEVSAVAAVQHSDVRYLIDCTHSQLTAVEDTEPEAALEFFIAPVFLASIVPKPCYEVHLKVEMSRLIDRFCECSQLFTFRNMVVWDRFLNAAGHLSRSRGHPELQVKLHETLAASQLQVSEVFQPGGLLSALDEEESEDGYESQL